MSKGVSEEGRRQGLRFTELVAQLEPRVRRRLRQRLGELQHGNFDIDDVLSSAIRRMFVATVINGQFNWSDERQFEAYVHVTAMRVALEFIRKERRHKRLNSLAAHKDIIEDSFDRLDAQVLQRIVRKLDDNEVKMCQLWMKGIAHANIAASMGLTIPAYRSRIWCLRQKLKASFAAECATD